MTTEADYEPELVDALNLLIEDERASVEMEVALASGATEYAEREALARMGAEDIHSCETLRTEMERADLPVTPQINGVVFEVLGAERYDDRLRSFARHQRIVAERATDLLESNLDGEMRAALETIIATHDRHIDWVNQRADAFAATRLLEFGPRPAPAVQGLEATTPAPEMPPVPDAASPQDESPVAEELPARDADLPVIEPQEAAPPTDTPTPAEAPPAPTKRATRSAAPRKRAKADEPGPAPAPRPRATRARKPTPPAE
ncbi:MAG TPA: DUF6306 domain-containing protein [Ktedonobacterales bacterium]